jgi:hypothetical protein
MGCGASAWLVERPGTEENDRFAPDVVREFVAMVTASNAVAAVKAGVGVQALSSAALFSSWVA